MRQGNILLAISLSLSDMLPLRICRVAKDAFLISVVEKDFY